MFRTWLLLFFKSAHCSIGGFIDDTSPVNSEISGYKVLGDISKVIIAIGDNWQRAIIVRKIKKMSKKINFIRVMHPLACIAKNVQICEGAVFQHWHWRFFFAIF